MVQTSLEIAFHANAFIPGYSDPGDICAQFPQGAAPEPE
jgi:hypothetical protein